MIIPSLAEAIFAICVSVSPAMGISASSSAVSSMMTSSSPSSLVVAEAFALKLQKCLGDLGPVLCSYRRPLEVNFEDRPDRFVPEHSL